VYNNRIDFLDQEKYTNTGIQFDADASGSEVSVCLLALESDMYLVTSRFWGLLRLNKKIKELVLKSSFFKKNN
jgi:hypothetical protein